MEAILGDLLCHPVKLYLYFCLFAIATPPRKLKLGKPNFLKSMVTRLTYNCAHLRWTKESLTFDYLEKGKLFLRKSRKTKKEEEENI